MRFRLPARLRLSAIRAIALVFVVSTLLGALVISTPQKAYAILNPATDFNYSYIVEGGNLRIYAYVEGDSDRAMGWTVTSRTTPGVCSFVPFYFNAGEINSHDNEGVGVPVNDGASDLRRIGAADALPNIAACGASGQLQNPGGQPANITIRHPERQQAFNECLEAGTTVGNMQTCVEENPAVAAANDAADEEEASCETEGGAMAWIMCPVIKAIDGTLNWLDTYIQALLEVDSNYYDNPGIRGAFAAIRNIAFIILVPIVLVMVIGTALGFDFVSAYTVKRAMPRLIIAVIFIALSYQICVFLIGFFNELGAGTLGIITGPFAATLGDVNGLSLSSLFAGGLVEGFLTFIIAAPVLIFVLSLFWSTLLIFAGIAFLVLLLRQIFIVVFLLAAPLAILAWIFPGNDKLWKTWWSAFSKLLIMYPLIMAVIAVGRIFAFTIHESDAAGLDGTVLQPIMTIIAYMIPYAFIPFTFKFAGGLFATVSGMANDRSKGLFDRARQNRQNRLKGYVEGTHGKGVVGRGMAATYRRAALWNKGGITGLVTQGGKEKFTANKEVNFARGAAKLAEQDAGRYAGDEGAMDLVLNGANRRQFRKKYAEGLKALDPSISDEEAASRADQMANGIEASFGASLGTGALRVAAAKAKMTNATGYALKGIDENSTPEQVEAAQLEMEKEQWKDVRTMSKAGLMSVPQSIIARKGNGKRADISAAGFADQLRQGFYAARAGDDDSVITAQQSAKVLESGMKGAGAGAWVGQRKESAQIYAAAVARGLNRAIQSTEPDSEDAQAVHLARALAAKDVMGQLPSQNATFVGGIMLDQAVQGTDAPNLNAYAEQARKTNKKVAALRRDFESRAAEQSAAMEAAAHAAEEQAGSINLKGF